MRVYEIDHEKKEYNTECGIFKEGDYVQVTLIGEMSPTKYELVTVSQDGAHSFFLLYDHETGQTTTQADVEIDDMIKVS